MTEIVSCKKLIDKFIRLKIKRKLFKDYAYCKICAFNNLKR